MQYPNTWDIRSFDTAFEANIFYYRLCRWGKFKGIPLKEVRVAHIVLTAPLGALAYELKRHYIFETELHNWMKEGF